MSAYPPEAVEAAANRLMSALALHEDSRGTVTDILADLYDQAVGAPEWNEPHPGEGDPDWRPSTGPAIDDGPDAFERMAAESRPAIDAIALTQTEPF